MVYKTHINFALTLTFCLTLLLEININVFEFFLINPTNKLYFFLIFLIGVIIGSVLPDIDIPQSYIGKKLKPLSFFLSLFLKHRGPTHYILIYVLLLEITRHLEFNFTIRNFLIGLFIGCIFHILGDGVTTNGIKNGWWPLKFNFKVLPSFFRFSVNGKVENFIFKILFLLNIYLLLKTFSIYFDIKDFSTIFYFFKKDFDLLLSYILIYFDLFIDKIK